MTMYPKIQGPCPHKNVLADNMDGDICRLCERQVVDLDTLSSRARETFFDNRTEAVCVSYRFPVKAAIAAAVLAAGAIALPLSAAADNYGSDDNEVIVVGAIHDPANVSHVADPRDAATPNMPVVYEDASNNAQTPDASTQPQTTAQTSAAEQTSAARPRSDLGHSVDRQ